MSQDPVTAQRLKQGLPVIVALASTLLVVSIMAALYLGREILVPVTLAILLSFVLVPAVRVLRRIRVPRAAAVLLVVVIVFGAHLIYRQIGRGLNGTSWRRSSHSRYFYVVMNSSTNAERSKRQTRIET